MALPQPKSSGHLLEDWAQWEGQWELIHGVAFDMTPAPSFEHQEVAGNLYLQIGNALQEARKKYGKSPCQVLFAPLDVFLSVNPLTPSVVQPDLVILCDPSKKSSRGIEGSPDLVVEILSPRTAAKDTVRKRWLYESAGVPEYLIVDPDSREAVLLTLDAQKRYVESAWIQWGEVLTLLGGKLEVTFGGDDGDI